MLPTSMPGNLVEAAPGLLPSGPLSDMDMMLKRVVMLTRRLHRDSSQSLKV